MVNRGSFCNAYVIHERPQCGLLTQHLTDRAKVRIGPEVHKLPPPYWRAANIGLIVWSGKTSNAGSDATLTIKSLSEAYVCPSATETPF